MDNYDLNQMHIDTDKLDDISYYFPKIIYSPNMGSQGEKYPHSFALMWDKTIIGYILEPAYAKKMNKDVCFDLFFEDLNWLQRPSRKKIQKLQNMLETAFSTEEELEERKELDLNYIGMPDPLKLLKE